MLILFDHLKKTTEESSDNITDNTTEGMLHFSPKQNKTNQSDINETPENPVAIPMIKVCVLLLDCYDIIMLLLFW